MGRYSKNRNEIHQSEVLFWGLNSVCLRKFLRYGQNSARNVYNSATFLYVLEKVIEIWAKFGPEHGQKRRQKKKSALTLSIFNFRGREYHQSKEENFLHRAPIFSFFKNGYFFQEGQKVAKNRVKKPRISCLPL